VEAAVTTVLAEARRAAEFGFTATEYNRYKADYLSLLEKQYSNKDKRFNRQFVNQYVQHFLNNEPIPSIDYSYTTMKQVVPMLPLEAINELTKELVSQNDTNLVILNFNNEKEDAVYPTTEGLMAAVNAARTMPLEAYVDNVKDEPLMTVMPAKGKIKKEVKNDKFGYSELTLSNGAKVVLKQTDLKKDQVILNAEGFGGSSLYGEKDYANIKMFDDVIEASGLGNFSHTELEKALAGKIANASLSISSDRQYINGSSTPNDVETMLQLMYLYFTNINKDQQSFDQTMKTSEIALKNRLLQPEAVFQDSLTSTLTCKNPRFASLDVKDLPQVNYDRILQIAKERTANAAAFTFTIIGNYDDATIRPLIEQYIASLPAQKKVVKGKDVSTDFTGKITNNFKHKSETPKAIAVIVWRSKKIPYTLENVIKSQMAGQVLQMIYLKKIREEASAAYTVAAQSSVSRNDYETDAVLLAYCPMKPEKGDTAIMIMRDEVNTLAKTCDADMLTKVKEYMLKNHGDQLKTNGYWSGRIDIWRKYGLDFHTSYEQVVQAQTPESISAYVAELLKAGNQAEIIMMPAE
jgi:zinc protease